jgi:hypothetical protein
MTKKKELTVSMIASFQLNHIQNNNNQSVISHEDCGVLGFDAT